MEKRPQRDFGRKFKLVHLIIVALVVMAATAVATYLITTGGFGAQKYYEDAKAYVEIEKIINENYIGDVTTIRFIMPRPLQWCAASTISGAIT